jgi:hypothetical protein
LKFQPVDTVVESAVGGIILLLRFDSFAIVKVMELPFNGVRKKALTVNALNNDPD